MKVLYLIFITFISGYKMRSKLHYINIARVSTVYYHNNDVVFWGEENDKKKTLNIFFSPMKSIND